MSKAPVGTGNFIQTMIEEDLASGKYKEVVTRFPPEPNGFLHIGHAKSICLNFGLAKEFSGRCNLRLDDTNPLKEEGLYTEAIKEDVKWLGFSWSGEECYSSDYFEQLYEKAIELIKMGKAYVDTQSPEEIRASRGTLTEPGQESPFRNRPVDESLNLFSRMRTGEFPDGALVLRAKIDMAHPNIVMRDPVLYRIRHARHHRTGDVWPIYPMYDFAHCLSDAFEGITHSLCTLEFENNRALYDWILDTLGINPRPYQTEFARLNLTYTLMSKRKLLTLVENSIVNGWDDPRLPTLRGLRRRGYTPASIRDFCERIGVARADNLVEVDLLEHCLREDLNKTAKRFMAVQNPLKITIVNYPDDKLEWLELPLNPEDELAGSRQAPFAKEMYIEKDDFRIEPPKGYHRLYPGNEVRLRHAYYIRCTEVVFDDAGEVCELLCTYDPETKGGWSADGRKVRGTIHWVSAKHAIPLELRLYERLFLEKNPASPAKAAELSESEAGQKNLNIDGLNSNSLRIVNGLGEPELAGLKSGETVQFERTGYFCVDTDSTSERLVFNRTASLKDSWGKKETSSSSSKNKKT